MDMTKHGELLSNVDVPTLVDGKIPVEQLPTGQGGPPAWGDITGTLSAQTDLDSILSGKAASSHGHVAADITGTAVLTADSRLADARTPLAHTHVQTDSHNSPDTDIAPTSLHHTVGAGGNQAAAGDHIHASGSPAWKGVLAAACGTGDPERALALMQCAGVISPTPTNISITVARCAYFKLDTALTVAKIRWYGVGATTGLYHVALYNAATLARLALLDDFNTAAATWGSGAFSVVLAANTLYFLAISVDTVGTTAGILALGATTAATTGQMKRGTGWPGSLDFDLASPVIPPFGFAQFTVSNGALPNPANALADTVPWTGGMPAFFLDSNNA
jgi:hypothetical protein